MSTVDETTGTPAELCSKFLYALAFNKGKIHFELFSHFLVEKLDLKKESSDGDELYLKFLILTLLSNEHIVIKNENGDLVDDKMSFIDGFDISSFLSPDTMTKQYKTYTFELTDAKLFELITGDKLAARNTLGDKSYELLLEIASHTKQGIDRITLCKRCNQDPRSLPSRMKKLEKYTISVNCLIQSRVTQHIWHKDFAENVKKDIDPLNTRAIERMAIMEKLKAAPEGLREIGDLKQELGVLPTHKEAKIFRKNYFWLDKYNYLERMLVKSSHNGRIYYCLKFLKDYLPEEVSIEENDDIDDDETIFKDVLKPNDETSTMGTTYFETSVIDSLPENNEAIFSNTIFSSEITVRSIVEKSGVDGTASMDILNGVFSPDFIKPFHKFMVQMVKDPGEYTSTLDKSPSQMVKVYDFEGKVKHYRIFSHKGYESKYGSKETSIVAAEVTNLDSCKLNQRIAAEKIKMIPLPRLLETVEYEDGYSQYYWIADMSPANKKKVELSNPKSGISVTKRSRSGQLNKADIKKVTTEKQTTDQPLQKIKVETAETTKPVKSGRLQNLSSVTTHPNETRSFGDFVGFSIRSIKTQQAILDLVQENNGLLCYFDKQIVEDIRAKMGVSYLIDKKVLKRDIINLLQVKKIKTFKFEDQLYLTSPVVTSEQVQYFHKNKLQSIRENMGLADRLATSTRNATNLRETDNIDSEDISNNKHLINNGFITAGIKCVIKTKLHFINKAKQSKFEKSNVKPEPAPKSVKPNKRKVKAVEKRVSKKQKKAKQRYVKEDHVVQKLESSFSHPLLGHIDEQLSEMAEQNMTVIQPGDQIKEEGEARNISVVSTDLHLEREVFKTNIVLFLKCCLVSTLLEKNTNFEMIGKLFRRRPKKVKEIFTNEFLKHKGDSWLNQELNNCRYFIGENIKAKKLDLADVENLEYVKIAKTWLDSEYEVSQSGLTLIEDVNEFRKLFAVESKPRSNTNLYFSEKSYFKTSLVKRYKGLLRKKYTKRLTTTRSSVSNYSAIKAAIKSVLLDQKGKNNKHTKVNVEIFSNYIQNYSQDELNAVLKDLSYKKILLMNNSGIQLNDLILDSFAKLDQTSFFQGFKKNSDLIKGYLSEKKSPVFEEELPMELSGYIFDRCDENDVELINLSGKYKANMKKDTNYSLKNEESLNTQMLIVDRSLGEIKDKSLGLLSDVPGLGIPYGNMWIDGNGDIRHSIWKICISHICHYLYLRPESTVETLSLSFKEFLDVTEIKTIIEWLKHNEIFKVEQDSKTETIDLLLASLLF